MPSPGKRQILGSRGKFHTAATPDLGPFPGAQGSQGTEKSDDIQKHLPPP